MTFELFHGKLWTASLCLAQAAIPAMAEDILETVDQKSLSLMVQDGGHEAAFEYAFEAGDELSEFSFTAIHGVGANIGEGRRFTRIPRADLTGATEWASHFPMREGGANATSCVACHNAPFANGAGDIAVNVVVDPGHSGDPSLYLERNTLPVMALGVTQRLAEEMSLELNRQRADAEALACDAGSADVVLSAKGVSFGTMALTRKQQDPCLLISDARGLEGIDADLVIRPFGWKGNHSTIRAFTRGAANNELGLQAVELVGDEDGDFDGVTAELTVGDVTAMTVYMAALERPVTTLELAELGLAVVTDPERAEIDRGEAEFASAGCTSCHVAQLSLNDPVFREPSITPGYFDEVLPNGMAPGRFGLVPATAVSFDLTSDQPNNVITTEDGREIRLGSLNKDSNGRAIAAWYTDLKRHDMGADLADPADPLGLGAGHFLTRSLAGVGSTGPWLHDGRATTLDEAIRAHGGEASESRDRYAALGRDDCDAIIAFLESKVLFHQDDES